MRPVGAAVAVVALALGAPGAASAASITVDPVNRCYRETQRVFLMAQGYSPNGWVEFTRDGNRVARLQADPSGAISGNLTLPGLIEGQRPLTYVGTDEANPSLTASVTLLTTATDVRVKPRTGPPNRRLTITGRGFWGGKTLWAHVRRVRRGERARTRARARVRSVRIGAIKGACRKVRAHRRLFRRNTAPGRYRVQFDTFRRYRPHRDVQYDDLSVRILPPVRRR
jgi:hypothetical protein